jgi:endonuclease V-like protein UPF0215 family
LLKREIRILGLGTGPKRESNIPVVGVVFRGSLWLDGAFACLLEGPHRNHASALAKAIMRTKQYSQLHAVILSERISHELDVDALGDKTKLAVIAIVRGHASKNTRKPHSSGAKRLNLYEVVMQKKTVNVQVKGLSSEFVRDVFKASCAPGHHIPEAVRVANLLAEHVPRPLVSNRRTSSSRVKGILSDEVTA